MPIKSEAQKKAVAKYLKNNYEQIQIRFAKGKKEIITNRANELNLSVNGYINSLIDNDLESAKTE